MAHSRSYRPWTQTACQLATFDIWSRQNNPRASVSLCKTSPLKLKNCFVTNHYSFNTYVLSFWDFAQIHNTCILKIVPDCKIWIYYILRSLIPGLTPSFAPRSEEYFGLNNFGPIPNLAQKYFGPKQLLPNTLWPEDPIFIQQFVIVVAYFINQD